MIIPMMIRFITITLISLSITSASCNQKSTKVPIAEAEIVEEGPRIPDSFTAALDALDAMTSENDREAFRNDEVDMSVVPKQMGMQIRNQWGLWSDSQLQNYFSERGIAHADWISSAIFEGWISRLKTGNFDEKAIIYKYAKLEKEWRFWSENPVLKTSSEKDCYDPFDDQQEK
jgi:hypothetical protein